jgi:sulfiredoxin
MMKRQTFPIARIYVPAKKRAALNAATVAEVAASILEVGQREPILVRADGERFVLIEGLHRLEACKALGEDTIVGYLVEARKH